MRRAVSLAMWITAASCSLPELPRLDPCVRVQAADNGAYCGSSTLHSFTRTSSPDELITCINQRTADIATCRTACVITSGSAADRCDPDPCARVQPADNGTYCGSSTQANFDPTQASPHFLYNCQNGHTMPPSLICVQGCTPAKIGTSDRCDT